MFIGFLALFRCWLPKAPQSSQHPHPSVGLSLLRSRLAIGFLLVLVAFAFLLGLFADVLFLAVLCKHFLLLTLKTICIFLQDLSPCIRSHFLWAFILWFFVFVCLKILVGFDECFGCS